MDRIGVDEFRSLLREGKIDAAWMGGRAGRAAGRAGARKLARRDHEEELHIACFQWVFLSQERYPALRWCFHTPNGGRRTKAQAGRFKAMGVRAGVVDILAPFPALGARGLAVELKRPGERPTSDQIEFLEQSLQAGFVCGVCFTLEEFVDRAKAYLGVHRIADSGCNWRSL